MDRDRMITLAIYTFEKAQILKGILENEGIPVSIENVNLVQPVVSAGVRVRIFEKDLPKALEIVESSFGLELSQVHEKKQKLPTILLPVDFSNFSIQAARAGFELAQSLNAEVVFLHTYMTPYFATPFPMSYIPTTSDYVDESAYQKAIKKENEYMDAFINKIKKMIETRILPEVPYTSVLIEGIPEDEIYRYSRDEQPLLVIMGTRGKDQKELDLLGSVTAEVLNRTPVPVLVIPQIDPILPSSVHHVAMMTTFDQRELMALERYQSIISQTKSIDLLHLSERKRDWDNVIFAGLKEYCHDHYPQISVKGVSLGNEKPLLELDNYIHKNNIQMLILTTKKRNLLARFFNPAMASKMLFHSDTPMMVIPI